MNTLYLDIFSGVSGDMLLGALLDLGVDFNTLEIELRKLGLTGYRLHTQRTHKNHIAGIKFDVQDEHQPAGSHHHHSVIDPATDHFHHEHPHTHADGTTHQHPHAHPQIQAKAAHDDPHAHDHDHEHPAHEHRTFAIIRDLIQRSTLSDWVKARSVAVFERIARAENQIHGLPPDQVHFHEVGALDSIIDIVGACIALDLLGRPRVLSAPVVEGRGFLNCAHGRYPLPGPATLAILGARGVPITQCEEPKELVTPTGAALLAEFAESFAPMQGLIAQQIGFGIGTRDNQTRPNVLRAILGTTSAPAADRVHDWETDTVAVLETNLDDTQPEVLGHFVELALAAGALDLFYLPVQMKKSRPGILLTLLCRTEAAEHFTEMILRETSAFGVRRSLAERRKLQREIVRVSTPWGVVQVKLGRLDGQVIQSAPEYESCRQLAHQANVPIQSVYQAAARGEIIP
jgi:pyridinium-3,5-bisthiocarboxylic acid mononucleotide nickel chelatase